MAVIGGTRFSFAADRLSEGRGLRGCGITCCRGELNQGRNDWWVWQGFLRVSFGLVSGGDDVFYLNLREHFEWRQ